MRDKDGPWIRARIEGPLGQWHMVAGHTADETLTACDRVFPEDATFEQGPIDKVPASERCPICQAVHAAASRTLT